MSDISKETKKLTQVYITDFIEKIFYFCLKKTGNTAESEDLASDISVNILTELNKGVIPIYFSAWIWKIARNRYSIWADKKHKFTDSVSGTDIEETELLDDKSIENGYILNEDLKLLRRELAFISKDYREIIVAFYIDDRKVNDIALSFGLPEGTIMSKLFRSRKILKEGMNMAREFGVRSYKPENVNFCASGSQPSGLPWRVVNRQIPKNILLEAHNNPSTVEELSIELGIALPYMEEEVRILTDATLLEKIGEKYITRFFIADKDSQMAIYQAQRLFSKERSVIIDEIISDSLPKIKQLKIMRNDMSDNDIKWLLVINTSDYVAEEVNGYNISCPVKRNDGGNWGFLGYEQNDIPEATIMGHNGCGNNEIAMFWAYKIGDYDLWDRVGEMKYNQVLLLADIIKSKRNFSTLTPAETEIWKGIENRFAHTLPSGEIVPDVAVFENDARQKFYNILESHTLYSKLLENYQKAFDDTVSILKSNSNAVLHEQLNYCASMFILDTRMMVIHDEVKTGKLIIPKDIKNSTIAMCLEIR